MPPRPRLGALLRRARWRASRWSADADRDFHDALFSPQHYDPFTFAYPGYTTIRRFADLASERLRGAARAADLGCGPGEITCELARRHPGIRFTGIDHSPAAIERARAHAAALGLHNVAFEAGDIARPGAAGGADIVLMFDAFHHLLDPAAFVRASGVDRFLLVEPAGTWTGGWQRTLDLDWIAGALDDIRARLLWEIGERAPAVERTEQASPAGRAVEHRYPLDDFRRFFAGFGLDVAGTIAGFDRYPPDPYGRPPLRETFGRTTYDALVSIEEALRARDLDLHAKHWIIYAERGAHDRLRQPAPLRRLGDPPPIAGGYDVEYTGLEAPTGAEIGAMLLCELTLRNRSWRTLDSAGAAPVFASYHWLDARGGIAVQDGTRTPLPRPVQPGMDCVMTLRVTAPDRPGRYTLAVDLVEEGVTWFSAAGVPMLRRSMRISSPSRR